MKPKIIILLFLISSIFNLSAQEALTIDDNGNVHYKQIKTVKSADISAADDSYDISQYASETKIGFRFRVTWVGGNGDFTFTFEPSIDITIDNIPASGWIGQGVGHLDLVYTGDNYFEVINAGEVWDSDGGMFSGSWKKDLLGDLHLRGKTTLTTIYNIGTFDIAFATIPETTQNISVDRCIICWKCPSYFHNSIHSNSRTI